MKTELDYISIASLNQYNYCPHRCWRMFCVGEFVDNQYTIEGTSLHDRVHTVGDSHREETWQVRAIWLKSDRYGLIGKADLIEEQDGNIYPVEYKRSATALPLAMRYSLISRSQLLIRSRIKRCTS